MSFVKWSMILALLCMGLGEGLQPASRAAEADKALARPGWSLVWEDEFSKPGLPDPLHWGYEVGFIRNRELQYYTDGRAENARVEGGHLVIEARRENWPNPKYRRAATDRPGEVQAPPEFAEYTSASVTTRGKMSWTFGRIEVRAKLPKARGTWPAIWTLGTNMPAVGWPACGEIDIMEFVGFEPGVVHANVHTRKYNHIDGNGKGSSTRIADASEAFHVYAVEWTPRELRFFVDDKPYFTYANEGSGTSSWPFDRDQYLILNLAIGGAWGGRKGIDGEAFPQRFEIDFVRVYRQDEPPGGNR